MAFTEVKVIDVRSGALFPSKAAMKRAIEADSRSVMFRSVSPLGQQWEGTAQEFGWSDRAKNGLKLTIVGPDPFTDRRWYGTVEIKNGKLKVS